MKKTYTLYEETADGRRLPLGTYTDIREAEAEALALAAESDRTIFSYTVQESAPTPVTARVSSYEDACRLLGFTPITDAELRHLHPREIARRKLETITLALNEGWTPDIHDTAQPKYFPRFRASLAPDGRATLTPSRSYNIARRILPESLSLSFRSPRLAHYAAHIFTELYQQMYLV